MTLTSKLCVLNILNGKENKNIFLTSTSLIWRKKLYYRLLHE